MPIRGARGADPNQSNCGPTAIAYVAGKTVPQVMRDMRRMFSYDYIGSPRWSGKCSTGHIRTMLAHYGFCRCYWYVQSPRKKLARWVETKIRARYVVRVGHHFMVVYFDDGWRIVDQHGNRTLASDHTAQNRMVTHSLRVPS